MPTVMVYRFTTYDGRTEDKILSTRWGTLQGIKSIGGEPLRETAVEVDTTMVGAEIEGLTARLFHPARHKGMESSTPTEADELR